MSAEASPELREDSLRSSIDEIPKVTAADSAGTTATDDFTLTDFQLHVVYNFTPFVGLTQFDGLELQHTSVVLDQIAVKMVNLLLDSVLCQRTRTIFRIDDDRIIR